MSDAAQDKPVPRAPSSRRASTLWTVVSLAVVAWAAVYTIWRPAAWVADGPSMLPGLAPGDRFLTLYTSTPRAGDRVVVVGEDGVTVVKRVVGVAGDSIEMRAGRLVRNGHVVTGTTRPAHGGDGPLVCAREQLGAARWDVLRHTDAFSTDTTHATRVPRDTVFVLGDYRDRSNDSRYFGPVRLDRVLGRVVWVARHAARPVRCAR